MSYASERIDHFLGGVSERPARLRSPSEVESQTNMLPDFPSGRLKRRPPIEYVGKLMGSISDLNTALLEPFTREDSERFWIVVADGDLKIFNRLTGLESTISFPDGKDYLATTKGFDIAAVGSEVWLANKSVEVASRTERTSVPDPQALIYIRQTDFSTSYQVTLNGTSLDPPLVTAPGSTSVQRQEIDTKTVAANLKARLEAENPGFTFTLYGSTIHVSYGGDDFDISGSDGLADMGMVIIKDTVQRLEDLPKKAKDGFVVRITGDPGSTADDYWVQYSDTDSPDQDGIWEEIPKPGTRRGLDPATMPHQLIHNGNYENNLVAGKWPSLPDIVSSTTSSSGLAWDFYDNGKGGTPKDPADDQLLAQNHSYVKGSIGSSYAGRTLTVDVPFELDDTSSGAVRLGIWKRETGTSTWALVAHEQFERDERVISGDISVDITVDANGTDVKFQMDYLSGQDPDPYHTALLVVHGTNRDDGGAKQSEYLGVTATFNDPIYPEGFTIYLKINGTNYWYEVSGGDETGSQVAQGIYDIIQPYESVTVSGPTLYFTGATTQPTVIPSFGIVASYGVYVPDLKADASVYGGKLLRNLTDGSEATISGLSSSGKLVALNTQLSGGATNTFSPGDKLEIADTGDYWIFRQAVWDDRAAGDEDTVPFPSFLRNTVSSIFFHAGRLGVTSGSSLVMSQAGKSSNFFRQTATQLLDDDVIDVQNTDDQSPIGVEWNEELYLWSDPVQYRVAYDPILTPTTVSLKRVSRYPLDSWVRPEPSGSTVFFTRAHTRGTYLMEAFVAQNRKVVAVSRSKDVPTLLDSSVLKVVADAAAGLVVVLLDTGDIHTYWHEASGQSRYDSWAGLWDVAQMQPVSMDIQEGKLAVLFNGTSGLHLGTMDIFKNYGMTEYLDHRLTEADVSPSYDGADTTLTLPYDHGNLVQVWDRDTGTQLPVSSWPTTNTLTVAGDRTATNLYIGFPMSSQVQATTIFHRDPQGRPFAGWTRLQLKDGELFYYHTGSLTVTVTPQGRSPYVYSETNATPTDGTLPFKFLTRNQGMTLVFSTDTPDPMEIGGLEWTGVFHQRR